MVSFNFDMGTRTMMGLSLANDVVSVASSGVAAVGTNYGRSLEDVAAIARALGR